MFKKTVSAIIIIMLLAGILTVALKVQPVKASGIIYIRADGSIDPPTAFISTVDNITYTLTGDINNSIFVERNSIVLDGVGFTVQGDGTGNGIDLSNRSSVTVKNVNIKTFQNGISLSGSSNNIISGNTATANHLGLGIVIVSFSNNNTIIGNNFTLNDWGGITVWSSSNNTIIGNTATNNGEGLSLHNSSSYNIVSGNNFTENGAGILVTSSNNNAISNNVAMANNNTGIYVQSSSNNTVSGNNAKTNVYQGIEVEHSSNNNVTGNNETANGGDGILLSSSSNNTVTGNNATANYWQGIEVDSSSNYNTVNGNFEAGNIAGIALGSSSNYNTVSGNTAMQNHDQGIILQTSIYNTLSGNTITANNVYGIFLYNSSSYNVVTGNNVSANSQCGILLDLSSNNNTVSGNTATANNGTGIYLYSSSNNSFSGNNITNNNAGIELHFSSNNIIYHNNFVNNTSQTSSSGSTNVWDNGYPSGGNYWSDYAGTDLYSGPYQNITGSDGIGDTPYGISGNNSDQDHYPLMQPYSSVETSVFCSPNPVSRGSPVTCTATVSGFNPTGNITWSTSSSTGYFNQSVCNLSNGTCSTTYTDNYTGSITIAAYYSGDSNNTPSIGSTILTVTSGGPVYYSKNYTTVQAAINAAPPGATVIIAPGFYTESLIVNKMLTIIGDKDTPVFSGGGSGVCITLLSGASGSVVTGIMITSFNEGVSVVNASNCGIYCNIFSSLGDTGIGIEGSTATSNAIYDNLFQDTPTPIKLTTSTVSNNIYGNMINSQATVTLNVGANGNNVHENVVSANQIILDVANSNAIYHNDFLASAQITVLATGNNAWDNGYPSGGNYWSTYTGVDQEHGPYQNLTGPDGIGDTPYVIATGSTDRYPLMKPWTTIAGHSVAVMSVITAKTQIGQGFNCNVTVVVADDGEYAETFSTTWYANDKTLDTRQVNNLQAMCPLTLTFTWNTTGVAYGNYTLSAYAWPVPGETDVADNNFTGGTVKVTISGDINGDFTVDIYDAILLAGAFNTNANNPHWNPNADINCDNTVDIYDAIILAGHFNQHYP